MSFACRDWLLVRSTTMSRITVDTPGTRPTLDDVFARHRQWQRRATRMLAIDPRDRARTVTRDLRAAQRRRVQRNLRKRDAG